ncbi:hypothetical protein ACTFIU_005381 [Dictyostelium citrinum]
MKDNQSNPIHNIKDLEVSRDNLRGRLCGNTQAATDDTSFQSSLWPTSIRKTFRVWYASRSLDFRVQWSSCGFEVKPSPGVGMASQKRYDNRRDDSDELMSSEDNAIECCSRFDWRTASDKGTEVNDDNFSASRSWTSWFQM